MLPPSWVQKRLQHSGSGNRRHEVGLLWRGADVREKSCLKWGHCMPSALNLSKWSHQNVNGDMHSHFFGKCADSEFVSSWWWSEGPVVGRVLAEPSTSAG